MEAQLVAAEPLVRQPVAIEFDDRGRLWVIQYLQYPNPAGLKRVKVDRYSRTEYDQRPEPPPRGPRGEDRITILEDTDGDGRADQAKDFVAGSESGQRAGLWPWRRLCAERSVPALLSRSQPRRHARRRPEVLLTGFGMEDAHSVANSLTWGPDGWLYGAQGSTVTSQIRGIEFQQGVWRYHPLDAKSSSCFAKGAATPGALISIAQGELFYSTNLGGSTMLHGVQGAYYWKSFGKHGALHNPYAFGYFDHVPHANFTGGHVTVGGVIYQGDLLPAEFRGRYIAGDLLGHAVYWHTIAPRGTTFQSAHGGPLLQANDTWFATSDVTVGPDGAVYVADWHDQRTAHPDPDATWDRRNGRVYRIQPSGATRAETRDLRDLPSTELVKELASTNEWYARRARRGTCRAARREDHAGVIRCRQDRRPTSDLALEALWALHVSGGLNDGAGPALLQHKFAQRAAAGRSDCWETPAPFAGNRAAVRRRWPDRPQRHWFAGNWPARPAGCRRRTRCRSWRNSGSTTTTSPIRICHCSTGGRWNDACRGRRTTCWRWRPARTPGRRRGARFPAATTGPAVRDGERPRPRTWPP